VADPLHVELVAPDRTVWSGEATIVITRTADGDIGILSGHAPLLGLLVDGVVEIRSPEGERSVAAVGGGFLSVAQNRVSILAEYAALTDEIDIEEARRELDRAQSEGDDEEAREHVRRAEARIRAVEMAS
jgi:F-type H+-transporting ATPase subunit epsilon